MKHLHLLALQSDIKAVPY